MPIARLMEPSVTRRSQISSLNLTIGAGISNESKFTKSQFIVTFRHMSSLEGLKACIPIVNRSEVSLYASHVQSARIKLEDQMALTLLLRKLSSLNVEAVTSMKISASSTSAERYDRGPAITVDSANRRGYSRRRSTSSTCGNCQPTEPDLADPWTKLQVWVNRFTVSSLVGPKKLQRPAASYRCLERT
jgi:hypothetical protein